jgi:site-specific recombinase XerD
MNEVSVSVSGQLTKSEINPLKQFPAEAYLLLLKSDKSRETMGSVLKSTVGILAEIEGYQIEDTSTLSYNDYYWPKLDKYRVNEILKAIQRKGFKPATQKLYLAAIRGVLNECEELGLIDANHLKSIKKIKVKGSSKRKVSTLTSEQVLELFGVLGDSSQEERDAAIMSVFLGGGLRRSEVANLKFENVDFEERGFHFFGKGSKERSVYLSDIHWKRFTSYLENVRGTGESDDPVFCRIWKSGELNTERPLTPQGIYYILQRLINKCTGIKKKVKPHDLRKTFATGLYNKGIKLTVIRDLLGHSSTTTTEIYIGVNEDELKQAGRSVT